MGCSSSGKGCKCYCIEITYVVITYRCSVEKLWYTTVKLAKYSSLYLLFSFQNIRELVWKLMIDLMINTCFKTTYFLFKILKILSFRDFIIVYQKLYNINNNLPTITYIWSSSKWCDSLRSHCSILQGFCFLDEINFKCCDRLPRKNLPLWLLIKFFTINLITSIAPTGFFIIILRHFKENNVNNREKNGSQSAATLGLHGVSGDNIVT